MLMGNFAYAKLVDVSKTSILTNQTNANDPLLLKQAYAQIIANNTGEPIIKVLQNPYFSESNVKSGIKRSYFEKIESKYLSETAEDYYWFHVVMHEDFIKNTIQQAGFSLLPHNRQEIILWAAKEEELPEEKPKELGVDEIPIDPITDSSFFNEPLLQYAYDDEKFIYWMNMWAQSMGLIFTMPEIDENDMLNVTPDSIKNLSYEAHNQTIEKYTKKLSLLLYLKRTEYQTKYRTGFFYDEMDLQVNHFQQPDVEEGELIYSVVANIAEQYANIYKIEAIDIQSQTVQIVINGLNGFDDVKKVQNHLESVSVIDSLQVVSAKNGQLVITVKLAVNTEAFLNIIQRQNILYHNRNGSINQLVFHLISPLEE